MDNLIVSFILSIIEGLTEFLPVSSSGHLILAGDILHFSGQKASTFEVVIQLGAILAVVVIYRKRFAGLLIPNTYERFSGIRGIWLLFLTSLPAGILGLAFHSQIKEYLFKPAPVTLALVIGAVAMILTEKWRQGKKYTVMSLDEISTKLAFGIGCFQCLALWPGFSRSAATIMGGMILGARRQLAAEYSFIAAVPIMFAATLYDVYKNIDFLSASDCLFFFIGMLGSFVSALLAIKTFVAFVGRITLVPFAIYRLVIAPFIYYFMLC